MIKIKHRIIDKNSKLPEVFSIHGTIEIISDGDEISIVANFTELTKDEILKHIEGALNEI